MHTCDRIRIGRYGNSFFTRFFAAAIAGDFFLREIHHFLVEHKLKWTNENVLLFIMNARCGMRWCAAGVCSSNEVSPSNGMRCSCFFFLSSQHYFNSKAKSLRSRLGRCNSRSVEQKSSGEVRVGNTWKLNHILTWNIHFDWMPWSEEMKWRNEWHANVGNSCVQHLVAWHSICTKMMRARGGILPILEEIKSNCKFNENVSSFRQSECATTNMKRRKKLTGRRRRHTFPCEKKLSNFECVSNVHYLIIHSANPEKCRVFSFAERVRSFGTTHANGMGRTMDSDKECQVRAHIWHTIKNATTIDKRSRRWNCCKQN